MIGEYARAKSLLLASQGKKRYLASGMTKNALDRILAARKMMGNAYHNHDVSQKNGYKTGLNLRPKGGLYGCVVARRKHRLFGFSRCNTRMLDDHVRLLLMRLYRTK